LYFRELELNALEADMVVKKVVEKLQTIDAQELPPLVFQLLSLANNNSKAQQILEGILLRINSLNESTTRNKDGKTKIKR